MADMYEGLEKSFPASLGKLQLSDDITNKLPRSYWLCLSILHRDWKEKISACSFVEVIEDVTRWTSTISGYSYYNSDIESFHRSLIPNLRRLADEDERARQARLRERRARGDKISLNPPARRASLMFRRQLDADARKNFPAPNYDRRVTKRSSLPPTDSNLYGHDEKTFPTGRGKNGLIAGSYLSLLLGNLLLSVADAEECLPPNCQQMTGIFIVPNRELLQVESPTPPCNMELKMKGCSYSDGAYYIPGCFACTDEGDLDELTDVGNGAPICYPSGNAAERCGTDSPTVGPTTTPTTIVPTLEPTRVPTIAPSIGPTRNPSSQPTVKPSFAPSKTPTREPSIKPTTIPSASPTFGPTRGPTLSPHTKGPSFSPTEAPTRWPSVKPSSQPSSAPSQTPTMDPTEQPSIVPTVTSSVIPSFVPTQTPTTNPSMFPSSEPTRFPSVGPTKYPSTKIPSTVVPSNIPTSVPTLLPSSSPTSMTGGPTGVTTRLPTTRAPSPAPTAKPTTKVPTLLPSMIPSLRPTKIPSNKPTLGPTKGPSRSPSMRPTRVPSTRQPSWNPSKSPTKKPSGTPSRAPTKAPTGNSSVPSNSSAYPTMMPNASININISQRETDDLITGLLPKVKVDVGGKPPGDQYLMMVLLSLGLILFLIGNLFWCWKRRIK